MDSLDKTKVELENAVKDNGRLLIEIQELKHQLVHIKMELNESVSKYESLCFKIKGNSNDDRNLTNYAKD